MKAIITVILLSLFATAFVAAEEKKLPMEWEKACSLKIKHKDVCNMAFSAHGLLAVTSTSGNVPTKENDDGSFKSSIEVFDLSQPESSPQLVTGDDWASVLSLSFGPDGLLYAGLVNQSEVIAWDTTQQKVIKTFRGLHKNETSKMAVNPWHQDDIQPFLALRRDYYHCGVRLFNRQGSSLGFFNFKEAEGSLHFMSFGPTFLAGTDSNRGLHIQSWTYAGGQIHWQEPLSITLPAYGQSIGASADGLIGLITLAGDVILVSPTGKSPGYKMSYLQRGKPGLSYGSEATVFSKDGSRLYVDSVSATSGQSIGQGETKVWDVTKSPPKPVGQLTTLSHGGAFALGPNEEIAVPGREGEVVVYHLKKPPVVTTTATAMK